MVQELEVEQSIEQTAIESATGDTLLDSEALLRRGHSPSLLADRGLMSTLAAMLPTNTDQ